MATKPRILCVDDEPGILNFFEALFVRNGYEVTRAKDGEQAMEALKETQVDIVISDVMMPNMDGFEMCRRIKRDDPYSHIPVILITSLTAKEDRVKGIEAGAEDFISKPVDPAEILARIKMLLEAKSLHERRIGELLVEMGFITQEQLQEALKVAKEQKLKVGEALHAIGALDKDRLYWVLSAQLKMNYIELSREMADKELIKEFSMEALKELLCLPLYETGEEIHFAIADPTDQDVVKRVRALNPGKEVQLHLALPEKITDILHGVEKEAGSRRQPYRIVQPKEEPASPTPGRGMIPRPLGRGEPFWDEFVESLLLLGEGEVYWVYRTPQACRLLSQRGKRFETVREYPDEIYPFIKDRLKHAAISSPPEGKVSLFLRAQSTGQGGAFKWGALNGLDGEMIQIERIPEFSEEVFFKSSPQAPGLIKDLQGLIKDHPRLLLGEEEKSLIKPCCYCLIKEESGFTDFPPPLFIESEMETYFPGVAQLSKDQLGAPDLLDRFPEEAIPLLHYEMDSPEGPLDQKFFPMIDANLFKRVILYLPFSSRETMEKALFAGPQWHRKGFKAFFLFRNQWKSAREDSSHAQT